MSLDLAAIVRQLLEVEAQHPDTAGALDPIINALSNAEESTVSAEQARALLGVQSATTVHCWINLGILTGSWDERLGQWQIPLADVLRLRATQRALLDVGGDDLTEEELDTLSSTRSGTFPWQRSAKP
jgi:hypothetical protein